MLSVVVYFINKHSVAVTRLIGLLELLGHEKTGIGIFNQFPCILAIFMFKTC